MTCSIPFLIEGTHGSARAGRLQMARGEVLTPVFMPVGTQAALRTLSPLHLNSTPAQIILANTYHLHQRPGEDLVAKHGGLHEMMNVDLPMLTDSGGFQVFSLPHVDIQDHGVRFKNEVTGDEVELTPERSVQIQNALGADIIMSPIQNC